jgi:predicted Zn-dependent protease
MNDKTTTILQKANELIETGRPQEALVMLSRLIRADADIAEAWYLLGLALDDSPKKLYAFRQVLRLDPSNRAAQEQVDRLNAKFQVSF